MWKREEDDDSELEDEGSSGSINTILETPETPIVATVPNAPVPDSEKEAAKA